MVDRVAERELQAGDASDVRPAAVVSAHIAAFAFLWWVAGTS